MVESLQPGVYACIFVTLAPATLTLGLRLYARHLKGLRLSWDDYLAIASYAAAIAYDISILVFLKYGLGLKMKDLPISRAEAHYFEPQLQETQEHTYTIAITAAQLSLLFLYWRLFESNTMARIAIQIMPILVLSWLLGRILVATFQCLPPSYFWNKSIEGSCTIDPGQFFVWSVSTHLAMDIALMVLPASQVIRLHLPLAQKFAIVGMFMFGAVVCVASIVMLVSSTMYNVKADEIMWNTAAPEQWSAVEIHLSVMACCLPMLRPVAKSFGGWFGQKFSSRRGLVYPQSSVYLSNVARHGNQESRHCSDSTRQLQGANGRQGSMGNAREGSDMDMYIGATREEDIENPKHLNT